MQGYSARRAAVLGKSTRRLAELRLTVQLDRFFAASCDPVGASPAGPPPCQPFRQRTRTFAVRMHMYLRGAPRTRTNAEYLPSNLRGTHRTLTIAEATYLRGTSHVPTRYTYARTYAPHNAHVPPSAHLLLEPASTDSLYPTQHTIIILCQHGPALGQASHWP